MTTEEIKGFIISTIKSYLRNNNCSITTLKSDCIPEYADDAAALAGGLSSGNLYKTTSVGSTFLKIVP